MKMARYLTVKLDRLDEFSIRASSSSSSASAATASTSSGNSATASAIASTSALSTILSIAQLTGPSDPPSSTPSASSGTSSETWSRTSAAASASATDGRKYCPYCDQSYSRDRAYILKRHIREVHEGVRRLCVDCGKTFRQNSSEIHLKTHSGGLIPFIEDERFREMQRPPFSKCDECPMTFADDTSRRFHFDQLHRPRSFR